jgi:hypothetical protein
MTRRTIARTYPKIICQARTVLETLREMEEELGIHYNTSALLEQELFAALGDSSGGAQGELNERRLSLVEARAMRDKAVATARAFCANAIDGLKARLGRRWNVRWQVAGFTQGSLAIPRDPTLILYGLRSYYRTLPGHEHAELGLTAAQAGTLVEAMNSAYSAVDLERSRRREARSNRDDAMERLRQRLSALHSELRQLLPRDDHRWRLFGFRRPIDKGQPDPVEGLELRPGPTAEEIIVQWTPSPRAKSYRVTKQVEGIDPEPVEVRVVHDSMAIVSGLPADAEVIIAVQARNRAGESKPSEGRRLAALKRVSASQTVGIS